MDDGKLIDLFFERSEQAIAELSRKYGNLCNRIARNILNNRQDSEECVNDAYLAVWNTVPPQRRWLTSQLTYSASSLYVLFIASICVLS